jgi:hypothetical protein
MQLPIVLCGIISARSSAECMRNQYSPCHDGGLSPAQWLPDGEAGRRHPSLRMSDTGHDAHTAAARIHCCMVVASRGVMPHRAPTLMLTLSSPQPVLMCRGCQIWHVQGGRHQRASAGDRSSTAKSQFLKYASRTAHRSLHLLWKASAAGRRALFRDAHARKFSSRRAVPWCSQTTGVVPCIDEFDKMRGREDRVSDPRGVQTPCCLIHTRSLSL